MGTPNMEKYRYRVRTRTVLLPYVPNHIHFYFVDLLRQKRTCSEKITKSILLFYCVSNLSLAFVENSGGRGQKRVNLRSNTMIEV